MFASAGSAGRAERKSTLRPFRRRGGDRFLREFLTYGPGIPRYVAIWLPLLPVLVAGLLALRVRRGALVVVVISTLPTFLMHLPPESVPYAVRYAVLVAITLVVIGWLALSLRAGRDQTTSDWVTAPAGRAMPWMAVVTLVALALAVRIPLAWLDPGISDLATASETAARQLLDGDNPYTLHNPHTIYGTYQYPAGTLLANVPLVAMLPSRALAGEEHLGARATVWSTDALAVALLVWGGVAIGHVRGGIAAGFAYALHPTVVRQSGMVVANDLALALAVVAAALLYARGRPLTSALLIGVAISVKPTAVVLVPLLLICAGWRAVATAGVVPLALQLPFWLWPSPGLHGVRAMLEPVARDDPISFLRSSTWFPLYAATDGSNAAVRFAALTGIVAAVAVAIMVGWWLRRHRPGLAGVAAGFALPLAVTFLLASIQRTNYQGWYLAPLLLAVGLTAARAPDVARDPPSGRGREVG